MIVAKVVITLEDTEEGKIRMEVSDESFTTAQSAAYHMQLELLKQDIKDLEEKLANAKP